MSTVAKPSRAPVPEGTIPVAIGLVIAGISSFAFLKVGAAAIGSEEAFKPVVSLWFATFALAPGLFLPLEQELGRALSARRGLGQGGAPVVRKVTVLSVGLAMAVLIAIATAGPFLRADYFDGSWALVAALIVGVLAYAPAHLSRGLCSGNGRFRSYSFILGADGVMRIALCLLLAAVGVKAVGYYGFAVALAPLFGVIVVAARGHLRSEPGPEASWNEVTPNLGWLLVGSLMAAVLVNAGPIAAGLLAEDTDSALVTRFGYGVVLSRIPLFLFQAVQAALLPRLSRLAATGEMDEFRRGFKRLMGLVVIVGVAGVAGAYLLGPFVVRTLYDGAVLSNRTLAMLALGSAFYMVALAIAQAIIALHGHALVALGWSVGMATLVAIVALTSGNVFRRVEIALVCGSAAAMTLFAWALRHRLRRGARPDAESVLEALTDMPLET